MPMLLTAKTDKATSISVKLLRLQACSLDCHQRRCSSSRSGRQQRPWQQRQSQLEEKAAAEAAVDAANAYVDATTLLTESLAAADLAAALAGLELANEYLNQSIEAATNQGIIPETTINVTVEGNVTSAEDLAEVITDIQYNYQRTGKGILLSSRAI
jgi:hypothetical protein